MSIQRGRPGSASALAVGSWHQLPSPDIVELAALAGFDFVVIDCEHGQFAPSSVADVLRAARAGDAPALVRIAGVDVAAEAATALDSGADGVIVPHVTSSATARAIVGACRYPPDGQRGASPGVRGWWRRADAWPEYAKVANRETLVGVMIEGDAAVEHADAILTTEGLDIAFIGPMDLTAALGCPGELDNPRLLDAVEDVGKLARAAGVRLGAWAPDFTVARPWIDRGVDMVAVSSDALVLHKAWRDLVEDGLRTRSRP